MNYYYKDNEILTKEDWKNAFISAYNGKENDIHWRAGRSGECLADDFKGIKASGEKTMIDMIRICLNTSDVELEKGYIEYPSLLFF